MLNYLQNGRCSFIFTTRLVHTTNATISAKKQFLYFSQFSPPYSTLVHKIILTISTNTPCLYTSAIFHLSLRTTVPTIYTKNVLPTSVISPIQVTSTDQRAREPSEDWHCFNLSLFCPSMGSDNRAHDNEFFIAQIQKIYTLQVWQAIQSTVSRTLNLLSLLPYPFNSTTRTHISLQTSCITWFYNPKFSILIY